MNKLFLQGSIIISLLLFSNEIFAKNKIYKLFERSEKIDFSYNSLIKNYTFLTLNKTILHEIYNSNESEIDLEIPINEDKVLILKLIKGKVLSDGFSIKSPRGKIEYKPGNYYKGKIVGDDESTAGLSFFNSSMMGIISVTEGNYVIGAINEKNPETLEYIIYNDADLLVQNPFDCHVNDEYVLPVNNYRTPIGTQTQTTGNCRLVELYLECDYKMYQDRSSNTTTLLNYVTGFMNNVFTIYSNENIKLAIKEVYVWTSLDPYPNTSSIDALDAFQNQLAGSFNGDVAHLLSTKSGNLGGVAYVDVLCNKTYGIAYSNISNNYSSFPTYSWTVEVVSHEMGHQFGSHHTHWCGWQLTSTVVGPIDTCYAPEGGCYSGSTHPIVGTIMSYCHLSAGISFTQGFGPLPGTVIRNRYNAVSCAVNPVIGSLTASNNGPKCPGTTITLGANAYSGSTFNWTGSANFISSLQNPTISNFQNVNTGNYAVTASYMGCTSDPVTTSLSILGTPQATLTAKGATAICLGESVDLKANYAPGLSYRWQRAGVNIPNANDTLLSAISSGTYKVIVTNTNNCTKASNLISVTVKNNPVIYFSTPGTISTSDLKWTQLVNASASARNFGCAAVVNGNIYYGLGNDGINKNDWWQFNPLNSNWSQLANCPASLVNASSFSINNKIYVVGGFENSLIDNVFEFDAATNIWTGKASFPGGPRRFMASCSVGNKGYIICGEGNSVNSNDIWEYDGIRNKWSYKASVQGGGINGRAKMNSFVIGTKIYFGLGITCGNPCTPTLVNDWFEFDPSINSVIQKGNFPGTAREASAAFSINGKGYISMGTNGNYLNDIWEYDPTIDTWIQLAQNAFPSIGQYGMNVAVIKEKAFFIGGKNNIGYSNEVWSFNKVIKACNSAAVKIKSDFGYSWLWSTGATTQQISTLNSGEYNIIATGQNSCNTSGTAYLERNNNPGAKITPFGPTTFCSGGNVVLKANTANGITYQWSKDNVIIPLANANNYTASASGSYVVLVTNTAGCTKSSSAISVLVNCREANMLSALDSKIDIEIIPNPATSKITVNYFTESNSSIQIFNMTGELIYEKELSNLSNTIEQTIIDISKYPAGIYLLAVKDKNGISSKKFIKE